MKIRASLLLLLLVTSLIVYETEAGFFKKLGKKLKKTVDKVFDWIKKTETTIPIPIPLGGRQKRSEKAILNCNNFDLTHDIKMDRELVSVAFDKADANYDDVLQDKEAEVYEAIFAIMNKCLMTLPAKTISPAKVTIPVL